MEKEIVLNDIDILHAFLHGEPSLVVSDDRDYGKLFEVRFTACCTPTPVRFWFNSRSRGIFLRIDLGTAEGLGDPSSLLDRLNRINLTLPVGAFVCEWKSGAVLYKNAVFVGELPLHVEILGNLVASSFEMVRTNYSVVVGAMTGTPHEH